MSDEMLAHGRQSIRLQECDYRSIRSYFVTICTHEAAELFGEVVDGRMQLSLMGEVVRMCWLDLPDHFPHLEMDAFTVMPNHMHGIIRIVKDDRDLRYRCALCFGNVYQDGHCVNCRSTPIFEKFGQPVPGSLPTIVRSFKSATTREVNVLRDTSGAHLWQRNYYERVIRDIDERDRIRKYIFMNPMRWDT